MCFSFSACPCLSCTLQNAHVLLSIVKMMQFSDLLLHINMSMLNCIRVAFILGQTLLMKINLPLEQILLQLNNICDTHGFTHDTLNILSSLMGLDLCRFSATRHMNVLSYLWHTRYLNNTSLGGHVDRTQSAQQNSLVRHSYTDFSSGTKPSWELASGMPSGDKHLSSYSFWQEMTQHDSNTFCTLIPPVRSYFPKSKDFTDEHYGKCYAAWQDCCSNEGGGIYRKITSRLCFLRNEAVDTPQV